MKQAQAQADQNFCFFLCLLLCLLQHFLTKRKHEAEDQGTLNIELFFCRPIKALVLSSFREFTKMTEAEGSLKKGFQIFTVCQFSVIYGGPFSLDTRSLCLVFLHLLSSPPSSEFRCHINRFFGSVFLVFRIVSTGINCFSLLARQVIPHFD